MLSIKTSAMQIPWTTRDLKRGLWREAGVRIIEQMDCGWCDGLCCILARAFLEVLGPTAHLMMLGCQNHPVDHVLVLFRGAYLDGDGVSTGLQLLRRWQLRELQPHPYLRPFDADLVRAADIPDDPRIVAATAHILRAIPRAMA